MDLSDYVHKERKAPSFEELCKNLGIDRDAWGKQKNVVLIKARTLALTEAAALYAYATLNVIVKFFKEKNLEVVKGVLSELEPTVNNTIDKTWNNPSNSHLSENELDERIKAGREAVAHAANIFNNTPHLVPPQALKATLEARDLCDHALRQPRVGP
ncbi:MAG: hypothetical protein G01um101419_539 [Parcubacteria group bacterium Gr01-1014_19]|nr:MAG: hypothetical protein G01um101419_539 [Parcubacteria group bacterium Gr01-1014_19]